MKELWSRFVDRAVWSWQGWCHAWREEQSLKQWVIANGVSATLAFSLEMGTGERALILALGVLVLAAELFNTAIERCVDYISTEQHPLAKQAKDAGSAGVAVTAIAAGVAWGVVILEMV